MISRNSSRSRLYEQSSCSVNLQERGDRRLQSPFTVLKESTGKQEFLQKHMRQVENIKVREAGRIRSNKPIDLKESMKQLKNYIDELRAELEHQKNKKDHLMRVLRIKN